MDNPRKFRAAERHFLNLPGYHGGAYVRAEVQDTADHEFDATAGTSAGVPVARTELEIADCDQRIRLWFSLDDADDRMNSFHKVDTLIAALVVFRQGMEAEAALRRKRLRAVEAHQTSSSAE